MTFLFTDIQRHIGSFLDPKDLVAFASTNTTAQKTYCNNLRNQYKVHFGSLTSDTLNPSGNTLRSLLSSVEKQPDATINHNIYQVPTSRLERWKWLVGVENSLDKKVQENYENRIRLLEGSQATSIIQLKNQLIAFWHSDRQIDDYEKFKSTARAEATKGKINAIFLKCVGFFLKLYSNSSRSLLELLKPLKSRSSTTFAKIGAFKLNEKSYDIVAFHPLADEKYVTRGGISRLVPQFCSSSKGYTFVGILEEGCPHTLGSFDSRQKNPYFTITIGRDYPNRGALRLSSEECDSHGQEFVYRDQRHLMIDDKLQYTESTRDIHGSDRLLDQKLTQIMVEMTMQNKDIMSLRVKSSYDDLIVLSAGGFKSIEYKNLIQGLGSFRSGDENKLFPPESNYGGIHTTFLPECFEDNSVYLSKNNPESWSEILKRSTLLSPDSAVLPEYWVKAPNSV